MRIAQVVPRGEQPWSGILTVIVNLSAALVRRGHHVDVWQLHEWAPDVYAEQLAALDAAGVALVPVLSRRRLGRTAASLAARRGTDLVHLHGAWNPSNTMVARALPLPYVFSPHSGYDPVSLARGRGRKFVYRLLFERAMLERAAMLTVLTDVELAHLRAFGVTAPCDVIPNGVDPPLDDLDRRAFRTELKIAPGALLAIFVGRLDVHRKGLDILVRGIADAPGWHLALVGPRFRDVDRLEKIVADLGAAERVHIVGERRGRSLQETMAAADLFALLSRWEGMPMALLEALATATPAVVSPAVERLVEVAAAGAGWVAEEEGIGPLLRRLERDGRGELAERGRAARQLSKRYQWEPVAERYEVTYDHARRSS